MPLDMRYVEYCQKNTPFYSAPKKNDEDNFFFTAAADSSGWISSAHGPWITWRNPSISLPLQGWKIHVTATQSNAQNVLNLVSTYCLTNRITFKHLRSHQSLDRQNWKYANRASSGKFITLYPVGDEEFESTLTELDELLRGTTGPYILSDRRWNSGPLYYRFGAFLARPDDKRGSSSVISPTGVREEDLRLPQYNTPSWVTEPLFLRKNNEENNPNSHIDFPFKVTSAMHFSNGGGVYVAEALSDEYVSTGTDVVLKEARPYAGLDPLGLDAIARLQHEADMLELLQDSHYTPQYYGSFSAWEHDYIVMEKISGNELTKEWMLRSPILKIDPPQSEWDEYRVWATEMVVSLDNAVGDIHKRGILLSDIHMHNILIQDGLPKFVDFEFAHDKSEEWRGQMGAPGYTPPPSLRGKEADKWALGVTQLQLFYPQAILSDSADVTKIDSMIALAVSQYGLSPDIGDRIRRNTIDLLKKGAFTLSSNSISKQFVDVRQTAPHLEDVTASICRHIISTMNPTNDPLFPSDIEVFLDDRDNALHNLAYGSSGVIWALANCNAQISEIRNLYLDRLQSSSNISPGLFRGKDGIALVLQQNGYTDHANELWTKHLDKVSSFDLWDGYAGIALAQLVSGSISDTVLECSKYLESMLEEQQKALSAGIIHGWSGPAVLWAKLYKYTQQGKYVDLAKDAIRADLSRCRETQTGTLEYDDNGWRTLPYLGVGSCGIGIAINELFSVTGDQYFEKEDSLILKAASYGHYAHSGLMYGLAGILVYLSHRRARMEATDLDNLIERHLQALRLHSLEYANEICFRGHQNLRLSTDYFTGAAGVLSALQTISGPRSGLPFFDC